uniref:Transposase n=1 Tax=Heterorhabditis bacteriophora TaxID=37862 RepID=A0A1I7WLB1_HETBA
MVFCAEDLAITKNYHSIHGFDAPTTCRLPKPELAVTICRIKKETVIYRGKKVVLRAFANAKVGLERIIGDLDRPGTHQSDIS